MADEINIGQHRIQNDTQTEQIQTKEADNQEVTQNVSYLGYSISSKPDFPSTETVKNKARDHLETKSENKEISVKPKPSEKKWSLLQMWKERERESVATTNKTNQYVRPKLLNKKPTTAQNETNRSTANAQPSLGAPRPLPQPTRETSSLASVPTPPAEDSAQEAQQEGENRIETREEAVPPPPAEVSAQEAQQEGENRIETREEVVPPSPAEDSTPPPSLLPPLKESPSNTPKSEAQKSLSPQPSAEDLKSVQLRKSQLRELKPKKEDQQSELTDLMKKEMSVRRSAIKGDDEEEGPDESFEPENKPPELLKDSSTKNTITSEGRSSPPPSPPLSPKGSPPSKRAASPRTLEEALKDPQLRKVNPEDQSKQLEKIKKADQNALTNEEMLRKAQEKFKDDSIATSEEWDEWE